ncbi:MAG: transglutaminase domain-containing protein [Clostridia bacterium]|nr:transglutaminase domain-containing protein [Clostridia bacterium]
MVKRSKFVYIIGSVIIGIISIIFIFAGLALSGVIDAGTTKLILKSASADKIYDGQVLTCEDWSIVDGALKKGHTAKVVMLGEQTNAGVSENKFDITITDKNGADVSKDYKIVTEFGTLTVNPFPLTVQSGSAEKDYDGTPLTFNEYTVESFRELLEGHEILVNITGSAVSRDAKNKIADVRVIADGIDVTHNYDITKIEGDLVIKGAPSGAGELSDGSAGELSGTSAGNQQDVPLFYVTTDSNQKAIYLREKSLGEYLYNDWANPEVYKKATNPLYYSGLALQQSGATAYTLTVDIAEENPYGEVPYLLPYYVPASSSEENNDTKLSLSGLTDYTVEKFYAYDYFSTDTPVTYQGETADYVEFVKGYYTALPEDTAGKMREIAETNGIEKTSATLIQDVASFVQGYLPYSLELTKNYEGDYAVFFFEEAEEAYCQHYATAATAMYRALGVPARWTRGYLVRNAGAGESTLVRSLDCHAWVEVYMDGFGWVPVEVTGGPYGNQEIDDEECDLIIRAMNRSQLYDDKKDDNILVANPDDWYIVKNELNLGVLGVDYEIVATVVGEQVGIGKSDATIDINSVAILKDGQDVTSEYTIKCKTGKLHIYKYKITVSTDPAEQVYDGTPLSTAEDDYTIDDVYRQLIANNGHTISVVVNGEQTNVGTGVNVADIVITDESGKDVTDYYKITKNFGELKVTLLKMTITAGSVEEYYDGTEWTCNKYTCEGVTVVDGVIQQTGHTIEVLIVGSQTNVGQSANTVEDVIFKDADGNDITNEVKSNYLITNIDGTLTVLPSETPEE